MHRLLLVEDNALNRDMLTRRLQRRGYEVLDAVNGVLGVEAAHNLQPDLILMDVNLPEMDGWEATAAIKSAEDTKHIPIIIITAHATREAMDKSRQAGADDYESKPVNMPNLIRKIDTLLNKSS